MRLHLDNCCFNRPFDDQSSLTVRLETEAKLLYTGLVEYFKAQAGERGYQTLSNETLLQAVQSEELEDRLRRILREEMHRQSR